MRIKLLAVLALSAFLFLAGCKGEEANTNANVKPSPTAVPKTSETVATDTATVKKIEDALKAKGYTDVTVDGSTKPITIRGTVAKGKLAEMFKVAMDAAGTPVKNEVTEK